MKEYLIKLHKATEMLNNKNNGLDIRVHMASKMFMVQKHLPAILIVGVMLSSQ
jgi:hypothetical protein